MRKGMSKKQLFIAVLTAVLFFGYLVVAAVFRDNEVVRLVMIGPYGVSAGIWFLVALAVLGFLSKREREPSD